MRKFAWKIASIVLAFALVTAQASGAPASRSFQMALWQVAPAQQWRQPPSSPVLPPLDTDIQTFDEGASAGQPAGRSIMISFNFADGRPLASLPYDWSRIVAVEVDEPYCNSLGDCNSNPTNPCLSTVRMQTINA